MLLRNSMPDQSSSRMLHVAAMWIPFKISSEKDVIWKKSSFRRQCINTCNEKFSFTKTGQLCSIKNLIMKQILTTIIFSIILSLSVMAQLSDIPQKEVPPDYGYIVEIGQ